MQYFRANHITGWRHNYQVKSRTFSDAELKLIVDSMASSKVLAPETTRELTEKLATLCSKHEREYFLAIVNASCRSFYSTTGSVFFLLSAIPGTVQNSVSECNSIIRYARDYSPFSVPRLNPASNATVAFALGIHFGKFTIRCKILAQFIIR